MEIAAHIKNSAKQRLTCAVLQQADTPDTPRAALTCLTFSPPPLTCHSYERQLRFQHVKFYDSSCDVCEMKMPRNHKQLKSICAPECGIVRICVCVRVCFFQVRFELFPIRWLSKLSTCFSIVYAQILQQFFFSLSLNINQLLFQIY